MQAKNRKIENSPCLRKAAAPEGATLHWAWHSQVNSKPESDEWIKKMWHIYTMEYYSAIKRNETELLVVRWMELESVIQSEVSQKEKNKYSMLTHIYGI